MNDIAPRRAQEEVRGALTPRDIQVILWAARGRERNDIAEILGTNRGAVNRHMTKVMELTNSSNGFQAIARVMALGLLTPEDVLPVDLPERIRMQGTLSPGTGVRTIPLLSVAAWVRSWMVRDPADDAEIHLNNVLGDMADAMTRPRAPRQPGRDNR